MCRNDGKLAILTSFTPPYGVEFLLFAPEPSVLDVQYQKGDFDLPAITTLAVQKQGSKAPYSAASGQHIYNLTGDNAPVNIHSHDQSTNTVNVTANQTFSNLRLH
jgi:hypothetical protein